jgi:hypothetical protein
MVPKEKSSIIILSITYGRQWGADHAVKPQVRTLFPFIAPSETGCLSFTPPTEKIVPYDCTLVRLSRILDTASNIGRYICFAANTQIS